MGYSVSKIKKFPEGAARNAAIDVAISGYAHDYTVNEWQQILALATTDGQKNTINAKIADLVKNNRGGDSLFTKVGNFFR